MALETSPSAPAPVRQIALAISQWVGRLGAVWVEGQMTQINRRPGIGTVFMTMRDSAADISVPVTCPRTLFDSLNPPLVEGASVVVRARPDDYARRRSHPRRVRHRTRARHPAARPGRRRPRGDPDRRRQAAGARHGRGAARSPLGPGPDAGAPA